MTLYWFYLQSLPVYERPEFKRRAVLDYIAATEASMEAWKKLASGKVTWDKAHASVFRTACTQ